RSARFKTTFTRFDRHGPDVAGTPWEFGECQALSIGREGPRELTVFVLGQCLWSAGPIGAGPVHPGATDAVGEHDVAPVRCPYRKLVGASPKRQPKHRVARGVIDPDVLSHGRVDG